jgi:hypothetical protein
MLQDMGANRVVKMAILKWEFLHGCLNEFDLIALEAFPRHVSHKINTGVPHTAQSVCKHSGPAPNIQDFSELKRFLQPFDTRLVYVGFNLQRMSCKILVDGLHFRIRHFAKSFPKSPDDSRILSKHKP